MTDHLYVHVPFCAHHCSYCDFVVSSEQRALHGQYVDALLTELDARGVEGARYATISIGGGTPTLLEHGALERLLTALRARLAGGGEFAIEANPETIDCARSELLASGGITRVSLGVQSLQPHLLRVLERRATPGRIVEAVGHLRDAGLDNLNADLIWAIPRQTHDDLRADLRDLLDLEFAHLSAYELEYHERTPFARLWGSAEAAVGDAADAFYDLVVDTLTGAGYEWYETSNFARAGRRSRHHLGYWQGRDYLGIGVGAVGTIGAERRTNLGNVVRYIGAAHAGEDVPHRVELVDERTKRSERIMLGLRLDEPVAVSEADRAELIDSGALSELVARGLVEDDGIAIRATTRGRMLLNSVLVRLLAG